MCQIIGSSFFCMHNKYQLIGITIFQLKPKIMNTKPSNAFIGASWVAMGTGAIGYIIGLSRSTMKLSEKGHYAFAFLLAIFGAVAVQKNIRDTKQSIALQEKN